SWGSSNTSVATVDNKGNVTGKKLGRTMITAEAKGIIGEAEVKVNPDTVVVVDPYYASVPQGYLKQFSVKVFDARNNMTQLNVSNLTWEIPNYGSGFDMFDIGSVSQSGKVTIDSNATTGIVGYVTCKVNGSSTAMGTGSIMVSQGGDCGSGNSSVDSINISNSEPIQLNLTTNLSAQVNATAYDSNGNTVSSPNLKYWSEDQSVATADNGSVNAMGKGTTTIHVCSGSYADATIQVEVN
ncbi:MAG: Ig-like domain-containing protein, partial [Flavobacteriales bacterium]